MHTVVRSEGFGSTRRRWGAARVWASKDQGGPGNSQQGFTPAFTGLERLFTAYQYRLSMESPPVVWRIGTLYSGESGRVLYTLQSLRTQGAPLCVFVWPFSVCLSVCPSPTYRRTFGIQASARSAMPQYTQGPRALHTWDPCKGGHEGQRPKRERNQPTNQSRR